ncbi:hypothetical protein VP01_4696g1, partial [Puccinia sorghi]
MQVTKGRYHLNTSRSSKQQQLRPGRTFHFENTNMRNNTLQSDHHKIPSTIKFVCHPKPFLILLPKNFKYELAMFSQSSAHDQTRSHVLQPESSTRSAALRLKNLFQVGYGKINLYTTRVIKSIYNMPSPLESWKTQEEKKFTSYLAGYPGSFHNSYVLSNMQIAQKPEKLFVKISSFWKAQLIQVIGLFSQLIVR